MTVKITAEFNSVDSAELSARNIRDTVKDISHIHIHSRKGTPVDYFYNSSEIHNVVFMNTYENPYYPVFPASITTFNELAIADEATIEVCCPKSEENVVTSKLSSYGGLKIKKRLT